MNYSFAKAFYLITIILEVIRIRPSPSSLSPLVRASFQRQQGSSWVSSLFGKFSDQKLAPNQFFMFDNYILYLRV